MTADKSTRSTIGLAITTNTPRTTGAMTIGRAGAQDADRGIPVPRIATGLTTGAGLGEMLKTVRRAGTVGRMPIGRPAMENAAPTRARRARGRRFGGTRFTAAHPNSLRCGTAEMAGEEKAGGTRDRAAQADRSTK